MPIEIFVSYRRSDAAGYAHYLHDVLLRRFRPEHVFFDQSTLEMGDLFLEKIDAAVDQCAVQLVLIGADWLTVQKNGAARLQDPVDVVRREIQRALAQRKTLIPVLFDSVEMPEAAALPDVLRGLAGHSAHRVSGTTDERAAALAALVDKLAQLPGVTPPRPLEPTRSPAAAILPLKLPLLCDRVGQDLTARDAIRARLQAQQPSRPVVLLLPGRVDEEHHAFVERLEAFSLPRFLKGSALMAGLRFVHVNESLPVTGGQRDFDERLRERLGEALDAPLVKNDAALPALMLQQKVSALVAVITWSASELPDEPILALTRVRNYWAAFPATGPSLLVGCIVCLKYDRPAPRKWLQRLIGSGGRRAEALREAVRRSSAVYAQDPDVAWCVAQELPSVTVVDLEHWVTQVRELTGHFRVPRGTLEAIIGGESRPMEPVLTELEKLVRTS